MKRTVIFLITLMISFQIQAQDETLISGNITSGGYGGPIVKFGGISEGTGVFVGGAGGWVVNHTYVIGGMGYGLANEIDVKGDDNLRLNFGCGGVMLEYIFSSKRLIHFNINTLIGAGAVSYSRKDYNDDFEDPEYSSDGFFILEPSANVMMNITEYFRIGAGVSYRWLSGVEYKDLTNSDLSGITAQIVLKFGKF